MSVSRWIPAAAIACLASLGAVDAGEMTAPHPGVFLPTQILGQEAWASHHPEADLTLLAGDGGTAVRSEQGSVLFRWSSWGRGARLGLVGAIESSLNAGNRLDRHRGDAVERLDNLPSGIKQTFILGRRPEGSAEDRVLLGLEVTGDFRVGRVEPESVVLMRGETEVMRYEALVVYDAGGKALPAGFREWEEGFAIWVDDRGARYPIEVDPVFRPLRMPGFLGGVRSDRLGLEEGGATVVAVDRDLCLVGVPGYDITHERVRDVASSALNFSLETYAPDDGKGKGAALNMAKHGIALLDALESDEVLEDVGAVFVFRLRDGAWVYEDILNDWDHALRMVGSPAPSQSLVGARFGDRIEIGPTHVAIGAPSSKSETWINLYLGFARVQGPFESGAVYFFNRPSGEEGFSFPQAWRQIDSELGTPASDTGLGGTRYAAAGHQLALGKDLALVAMGEGFDPFELFVDPLSYGRQETKIAIFDRQGAIWVKRPDLTTEADFDDALVALEAGPNGRFVAAFDDGLQCLLVELMPHASEAGFTVSEIGVVPRDISLQLAWDAGVLAVGLPSRNRVELYQTDPWTHLQTLEGGVGATAFGRDLDLRDRVLITSEADGSGSTIRLWQSVADEGFVERAIEALPDWPVLDFDGDGQTLAILTAADTIEARRFDRQIHGVMRQPDGRPLVNWPLKLDRGGIIARPHANRLASSPGRMATSYDSPWKLNDWWGCDLRFWVADELPYLDGYRLEVEVDAVSEELVGRRITAYASLPLQNYEWGGEPRYDTPGWGMGSAVLKEGTLQFELWDAGFHEYAERYGVTSVGEWSIRFAIEGPEGEAPRTLVEIGGARLILEEFEAVRGVLQTDGDGRFELSGLTASRYRISPEGAEYRGDSGWIDLQTRPVAAGLEVLLEGNLAVAGTLRTPSGRPIAGAVIRCGGGVATTDGAGGFRIDELAPGEVVVRVDPPWTAADGGPVQVTVDPSSPSAKHLDLSAVATESAFYVQLQSGAGTPVAGVRVRVSGPLGYATEVVSGADGRLALPPHAGEGGGLFRGRYHFEPVDTARDWPRGGLEVDFDGGGGGDPLGVLSPVESSWELTLEHGGVAWAERPIRVARRIGQVAGTRRVVSLVEGEAGVIRHAAAREVELSRIEIAAGDYELLESIEVRHDGGTADWALDSGSATEGDYVLIGPGGDELVLGPASIGMFREEGRFFTRVLRSEAWRGRPAAGSYRLVWRAETYAPREFRDAWILKLETLRHAVDNERLCWTDGQGVASAEDLPSGSYFFLAADPDTGRPLEALDPARWRQSWEGFEVPSGTSGGDGVSAVRRNRLSGDIRHSGEPLAGVRVEARSTVDGTLLASALSDLEGAFVLERVPSGRVDLAFARGGFRFSGDGWLDQQVLGDREDLRVEAEATGTIEGQLTLAGTPGPAGIAVRMQSVEREFPGDCGIFEGGTWVDFELPIEADARIGSLELELETSDANEITELVHPDGTVLRLESYNTEAGERRVFVDGAPAMEQDAQVSGRERFSPLDAFSSLRGKPLAGTWTLRIFGTYAGAHQLRHWSLRATALIHNGRIEERHFVTGVDGSYRFSGVAPGFYQVEVSSRRFVIDPAIRIIDQSSGADVRLQHAAAFPGLAVAVTDAEGAPMEGVESWALHGGSGYQATSGADGVATILLPEIGAGTVSIRPPEGFFSEPEERSFAADDLGAEPLVFVLEPQQAVEVSFGRPALAHPALFEAALLEATASVPGTFSFSLAEGAPLAVGVNPIGWSFVPEDARRHASLDGELILEVSRATPSLALAAASRRYDGGAAGPEVVTDPAGLPVEVIFADGGLPVDPGRYPVTLRVDTGEYFAEVDSEWTIERATVDLRIPEAGDGRVVRTLGQPAAGLTVETTPHGWWVAPDGGVRTPADRGSLLRVVPVGASVSQSTTLQGYPAGQAIDGMWWTFSHTQGLDPSPSWQVGFAETLELDVVRLLNRSGYRERLSDVSSRWWDIDGRELHRSGMLNPGNALAGPAFLDVEPGWRLAVGGVEVTRDPSSDFGAPGVLTLAEVEFLRRSPLPPGSDLGLASLANRTIRQSPDGNPPPGNGYAVFAMDGDPETFTHTVADPGREARWVVDWGEPMLLESVRLLNRANCCQARLRDVRVEVYDGDDLVWTSEILNPGNALGGPMVLDVDLYHVDGSARLGTRLEVVRTPDPASSGDDASVLSLGEVTVLGSSLPRFAPVLSYESVPPGSYGPTPVMPTAAGAYAVTARVDTPRHFGESMTDFLILPEQVSVGFPEAADGEIRRIYDGSAAPVAVVSDSPGVELQVLYEGITRAGEIHGPTVEAPRDAGSYTVTATVAREGFVGGASLPLVIEPRPFAIVAAEGVGPVRAGERIDLEQLFSANGGELSWRLDEGQALRARPICEWRIFGDAAAATAPAGGVDGAVSPFVGVGVLPGSRAVGWTRSVVESFEMEGAAAVANAYDGMAWVAMASGAVRAVEVATGAYSEFPLPDGLQPGGGKLAGGDFHAILLDPAGRPGVVLGYDEGHGIASIPEGLAGETVVQIASGRRHLLALTDTGEVFAWGSDAQGQVSVPDFGGEAVMAIAADGNRSAALTTGGTFRVWGENPLAATQHPTWRRIAIGQSSHYAIDENGTLVGSAGIPDGLDRDVVEIRTQGNAVLVARAGSEIDLIGAGRLTGVVRSTGDANTLGGVLAFEWDVLPRKASVWLDGSSDGSLSRIYDGSRVAAPEVVTVPEGLSVALEYEGVSHGGAIHGPSPLPPVDAGTYTVRASVEDADHEGSLVLPLVIEKAVLVPDIGSLNPTYLGAPLPVTIRGVPEGVAVAVTYDGAGAPPVLPGSYRVRAVVEDSNYQGGSEATLVVARAAQTVEAPALPNAVFEPGLSTGTVSETEQGLPLEIEWLEGPGEVADGRVRALDAGTLRWRLKQAGDERYLPFELEREWGVSSAPAQVRITTPVGSVFDGLPHGVRVVTEPPGLPVLLRYNGAAAVPVAAGQYEVEAIVVAPGYSGSAVADYSIAKAPAVLAWAGLDQVYDGARREVTVIADPPGLDLEVSYSRAPVNAGSVIVTAIAEGPNHRVVESRELTIGKRSQVLSFPAPAAATYGSGPIELGAAVDSGLPVSYRLLSGLDQGASLVDGTLVADRAGTFEVIAEQRGDANHEAAASVIRAIVVTRARVEIGIEVPAAVYNQQGHAVTVVSSDDSKLPSSVVQVQYNGLNFPPVDAGRYEVRAYGENDRYFGEATATLVVERAVPGAEVLATRTYSGAPLEPSVATTPAGLAATWSFPGRTTPPVDAGAYQALLTIDGENHYLEQVFEFTIEPATAAIGLASIQFSYTGDEIHPLVTTLPAGLAVDRGFTALAGPAAGQRRPFLQELGDYLFDATIGDPNHVGSASFAVRVVPTPVRFTQTAASVTYTGAPGFPPIATEPAGVPLSFAFSRTGSSSLDLSEVTAPGIYDYRVSSSDPGFTGSKSGQFEITPRPVAFSLEADRLSYRVGGQWPVVVSDPPGIEYQLVLRRDGAVVERATAVGDYEAWVETTGPGDSGSAVFAFSIVAAEPSLEVDAPQSLVLREPAGLGIVTNAESAPVVEILSGDASWDGARLTAHGTEAVHVRVSVAESANFSEASRTFTLPVEPPVAVSVALSALETSYDGLAKEPQVMTEPPGLAVALQFAGLDAPPVDAGDYDFEVVVVEPGHQGSARGTLRIARAAAEIVIGSFEAVYDGFAFALPVSTVPAGLEVAVVYERRGQPVEPVDAGAYSARIDVVDPNYAATEELDFTIAQAFAGVEVVGAAGGYLIAENPMVLPEVRTVPPDLATEWRHQDLSSVLPFEEEGLPETDGLYRLSVEVADPNYRGSARVLANVGGESISAVPAESLPLQRTYDGAPVDGVLVEVTPSFFDTRLSFRGVTYAGVTYGPAVEPPTEAGDYQVEVEFWFGQERLAVIETFPLTVGKARPPFEVPVVGALKAGDELDLRSLSEDPSIAFEYRSGPATPNRRLEAWGSEFSGIVSEFPEAARSSAVRIATSGLGAMALLRDGSVLSWGSAPAEVPGELEGVVDVALTNGSCAVLDDEGRVTLWGTNQNGELDAPAGIQGRVVKLVGGADHYLALLDDGSLAAWGNVEPVPAHPGRRFRRVFAGGRWCGAIDEEGTALVWGANFAAFEQLHGVELPDPVTELSLGFNRLAAVSGAGELTVWGASWAAPQPDFDEAVGRVRLSGDFGLAILADGSVRPWPSGSYIRSGMPDALLEPAGGTLQLEAGSTAALALIELGTLLCTGDGLITLRATAPATANFLELDREFSIRVGPAPLEFSFGSFFEIEENTPFTASPGGVSGGEAPYRWMLEGEDAASFLVDSDSGAVTLAAQDYERPADLDADRRYRARLVVTDASGVRFGRDFEVGVTDVESLLPEAAIDLVRGPSGWQATAPGVASISLSFSGRMVEGWQSSVEDPSRAPTAPGFYRVTATSQDPDYIGARSEDYFVPGPLVVDDEFKRPADGAAMTLGAEELLVNDLRIDAEGAVVSGGLEVTAVESLKGPTVAWMSGWVLVGASTPGGGVFRYTVSDGSTFSSGKVVLVEEPGIAPLVLSMVKVGIPEFDGERTRVSHEFASVPGVTLEIEVSADLIHWVGAGVVTVGPTGHFPLEFSVAGDADWRQMFFRARRVSGLEP